MEHYISIFIAAAGILIALTNAIVEVLKKIIPDEKFSTNLLAVIVAEVLTVFALLLYLIANSIAITWYFIFGALVLGLLVAYGAMFGYDKLMEIIKR